MRPADGALGHLLQETNAVCVTSTLFWQDKEWGFISRSVKPIRLYDKNTIPKYAHQQYTYA